MGELNVLHTDDEAMRAVVTKLADDMAAAATDAASVAEDERAAFLREFDAQVDSDIRPELEAAAFTVEGHAELIAWVTEESGDAGGKPVTVAVALHVSARGSEEDAPDPSRIDTEVSLVLEALPEVQFVRVSVERRSEQHALGAFTVTHLDQAFVEDLATRVLADITGS